MKKSLLALACAIFLGQNAFAQAQEVTYVEDPSQGYLFNKFQDNWFITGEGGANVLMSPGDSNRDFLNRFEPNAGLYVGKWFSPVIGLRAGAVFQKVKGLSEVADAPGVQPSEGMVDGMYKQKFVHLGPQFDAMLNLTNWICGYKPGRWYNLTVYGGVGMFWTLARDYKKAPGAADYDITGYKDCKDKILTARGGIINSFNVSEQVQLSLDLRLTAQDNHRDQDYLTWNKTCYDLSANIGVTYLFKKREWNAPVVPVCPEPENCDQYRALLAAADARIADLEAQLKNCLEKPAEIVEVVEETPAAPLATIYFPINVSKLTAEDIKVVNACADVMLSTPDTKYVVTGWADNYTGNDRINTNLRKNRAASVERQLLKAGVPASQFTVTINNGNLVDMGEKFVALDRATTIQIAE